MSFLSSKQQFESAFRSHYAGLVRYATHMLQDQDAAEDIVQQVFVRLWEKREEVDVTGNEMSYLMRSVHNACLNEIKHHKVRQEHAEHVKHVEDEAHVTNAIESEEFKMKVKAGVQSLPTECKKIFLMSRIQGKKYQQIADELGISIKTVENQMGKALRLMREALKEEAAETLRIIKTILWLIVGVKTASVVIQ